MNYEEKLSGFDWGAFSSIVSSLGSAASNIYASYVQADAVAKSSADSTQQMQALAEIKKLELEALKVMQAAGVQKGAQMTDLSKTLGIVGGLVVAGLAISQG